MNWFNTTDLNSIMAELDKVTSQASAVGGVMVAGAINRLNLESSKVDRILMLQAKTIDTLGPINMPEMLEVPADPSVLASYGEPLSDYNKNNPIYERIQRYITTNGEDGVYDINLLRTLSCYWAMWNLLEDSASNTKKRPGQGVIMQNLNIAFPSTLLKGFMEQPCVKEWCTRMEASNALAAFDPKSELKARGQMFVPMLISWLVMFAQAVQSDDGNLKKSMIFAFDGIMSVFKYTLLDVANKCPMTVLFLKHCGIDASGVVLTGYGGDKLLSLQIMSCYAIMNSFWLHIRIL